MTGNKSNRAVKRPRPRSSQESDASAAASAPAVPTAHHAQNTTKVWHSNITTQRGGNATVDCIGMPENSEEAHAAAILLAMANGTRLSSPPSQPLDLRHTDLVNYGYLNQRSSPDGHPGALAEQLSRLDILADAAVRRAQDEAAEREARETRPQKRRRVANALEPVSQSSERLRSGIARRETKARNLESETSKSETSLSKSLTPENSYGDTNGDADTVGRAIRRHQENRKAGRVAHFTRRQSAALAMENIHDRTEDDSQGAKAAKRKRITRSSAAPRSTYSERPRGVIASDSSSKLSSPPSDMEVDETEDQMRDADAFATTDVQVAIPRPAIIRLLIGSRACKSLERFQTTGQLIVKVPIGRRACTELQEHQTAQQDAIMYDVPAGQHQNPTNLFQQRRQELLEQHDRARRATLIDQFRGRGYQHMTLDRINGTGHWRFLESEDRGVALFLGFTSPQEAFEARARHQYGDGFGTHGAPLPVVLFRPEPRYINPARMPRGAGHFEFLREIDERFAHGMYSTEEGNDSQPPPSAYDMWAARATRPRGWERMVNVVWVPQ